MSGDYESHESNQPKITYTKNFLGIKMSQKVVIEYQDQFGYWKHYQTMHHVASAYKTASNRARVTGKRHRLMSEGNILDLCEP
jgi:hypothetical protein